MAKDIVKELKDLIMEPGVSGYEGPVREYLKKRIGKHKGLEEDNMGNLILRLGQHSKNAPSIAFVAHMDEVGLLVTNILDDGTVKFKKIGGIYDNVLPARAVEIQTSKGVVPGAIGFNAPHLRLDDEKKKAPAWHEMCIDVGTRTRKETEKLGIQKLDSIIIKKDFFIMNKKIICSRSHDNRVSVTALAMVYEEIKNLKFKGEVALIWTVQEEIGLRGARVIANTNEFDYVFALDTYSTSDSPGLPDLFEPVKLGDGPVLRMVDARVIASPKLRDIVTKIADKAKVKIQYGVTGGSTDGMALQESGAATLPIGIPMRYTHSPTECIHIDDLKNYIKLITAIVKDYQK